MIISIRGIALRYLSFADSRAGTQPEDRGASETLGGEWDATNALQQEANDGEGANEDSRGNGRSGKIDKRSFLAAPAWRARAGQAESFRGHEERISGEEERSRASRRAV